MSRETPISVSSESDSPIVVTTTSNSESAQAISFDRNPDVALVSEIITVLEEDDQRSDTIEHVDSESDDLEVLEAEVETAHMKREEREALEKLAKARRARGSNACARSVRSSRSVRSAISSETFAAQRVANALTSQSAPREQPAPPAPSAPPAPPAPPAPTAPEHQPELPTALSSWLEWFATHAPSRNGPLSREEIQMLADAGVPQNSEFPAFVNPYVSVRNRIAELERAQTGFEHGSDHGKGVQRFFDECDWVLQSARTRVQELESLIKRQDSRTSFESVVSVDPQTRPCLLAATLHSRPMSVALRCMSGTRLLFTIRTCMRMCPTRPRPRHRHRRAASRRRRLVVVVERVRRQA